MSGGFGEGRRTAGAGGKVLELLEEGRELRSLLTRLVGDSRRGQEPAHGEALRRRRRCVLLVERDLADLGLRELLRAAEILPVLGGADVPGREQNEDGPAHGVLRPAERRPGEPLLEVGALGAPRADRGQHFLAHRVRGRLSVVANGVERVGGAIAGLRDDLPPVGVVALRELREQPDERSVGGGLDRRRAATTWW